VDRTNAFLKGFAGLLKYFFKTPVPFQGRRLDISIELAFENGQYFSLISAIRIFESWQK